MKNFYKSYLPHKKKEILLVMIQFIIIFFNFKNLISTSYLSTNIYLNILGKILIISGFISLIISVKDLGMNISPFPTPLKNANLVTFGFYKWISHPIYYSTILISVGILIKNMNIFNLILSIILIIIFKFKIKLEEDYLRKKYKNYQFYKKVLII